MKKIILIFFCGLNLFCSSQTIEPLKVDFCLVPDLSTNKAYANITITNITKKNVECLFDIGYLHNPEVFFWTSDSIVSDTLFFYVYHPKKDTNLVFSCNDCKTTIQPKSVSYTKNEVLIITKNKNKIINLVFNEAQLKQIKYVKIIIYGFVKVKDKRFQIQSIKSEYLFSKPFKCIESFKPY